MSEAPAMSSPPGRVQTGISGLDDVLRGGFPANRLHLVQGTPGTGKTTLALQFLLEGARQGERVLYVTLAETKAELQEIADSHGWDIGTVPIYELTPAAESFRPEQQYTVFHPGEVEFTETIWAVLEEVERTQPQRLVLDSMAELKLIANDMGRYRRQVLGLKQFFAGRGCTVLVLDNLGDPETSVESIAHSVIRLQQVTPEHGGVRRRLHVVKVRGVSYRSGYHDFLIQSGGVHVFPHLVAAEHRERRERAVARSGVEELDLLLGGGLTEGTSTLLIGPAGAGKSVIVTQYAVAAAERGERSAIYIFDEGIRTFLDRAESLGIPARQHVESGMIELRQLDTAEVTPGEFDALVRGAVDEQGVRFIAIDSLNGYLNAMSEEQLVVLKLHELLAYLNDKSIVTTLTMAQQGLIGDMRSPLDVSYLADTVILMRYFEAAGQFRQAISVIKRRTGPHERSIREFKLDSEGIHVGPPLTDFHGIMQGAPTFVGSTQSLMADTLS